MRSLIDPDINYGRLESSAKFARVAVILDGTLRPPSENDDPDLEFVFDIEREQLPTVTEINALGVERIVIQTFVKLDKDSNELYKKGIQFRSKLLEIVEYETTQRLIDSCPKHIAKQNFELVNVWVDIIPQFCDYKSVVRHKLIESWDTDGQRFPFGIGLKKFYDEINPKEDAC